MKKTYIIPEARIVDCQNAILLGVSGNSAQKISKTTYTVGDDTQEYESDGY